MQLVYVHGLNSDEHAIKGAALQQWCQLNRPDVHVIRPNLNKPPKEVMHCLASIIKQDSNTVMVGSSLGGFYVTACVAHYGIRAVLINPSVRPFESMHKYLPEGVESITTETGWVITRPQFDDLKALFNPVPLNPANMLVLLKQGDEVLDYRIAQTYYSQEGAQCPMVIEQGGDHFMHDFASKIPLIAEFLF